MNPLKNEKKFNVTALGNALVDMEFEVENSDLQKLKVEKGTMTLVDEERQHFLTESLNGIFHRKSCGGSAANTMIALAQLGGAGFYSCKVADDELGHFYHADLLRNHLSCNLKSDRLEKGKTGKCLVMITPDADRTMNTFLGMTANFSSADVDFETITQSAWLYLEGYLVTGEKSFQAMLEAIKVAKAHDVKVALTFSDVNMVNYFRPQMDALLDAGIDLLFCNEAEALCYANIEGGTESSRFEQTIALLKKRVPMGAITLGSKGAYVYNKHEHGMIVSTPIKAIDTNGAGDLFAGAFLYAITHGENILEAGRLGVYLAGVLVTQFGARLKLEQVQELKKVFYPA